jgi:Heme NO binding.
MYGIVNRAIEDLVKAKFGDEKWDKIKERSLVDIDFFISNEPYDDAITYKLASVAAQELNIPLSVVLHEFGEWWVLKTSKEKYGGLMEAGGDTLHEFLCNLPIFHNRVMLIYPKLTPPEFQISHIEDRSVHVHYISKREGLHDFVKGLLTGLGKLYKTPVSIALINSKLEGADHDIFKVSW